MVKKTAFKPADPPLMAADPKNVATAVALKELYCAPKREIDPESGEPIEPAEDLLNEFESENIVGDAAMYEAVGLGLGLAVRRVCLSQLGGDQVVIVIEAEVEVGQIAHVASQVGRDRIQ